MITVFILTAHLSGGFTMMPFASETACNDAIDALPLAVIAEAECYQIEMIARGSRLAPEMAPVPIRKPGETT
jgi:hypothetical protein